MMDKLFPTMVVGSLPRPVFIRELIERRKYGEVSEAEADLVLDDAVPTAIRLQEAAGVDFVSDGEWRRESYVKIFVDAVAGFGVDLIRARPGSSAAAYPAVISALRQERPLALSEAKFLLQSTTRRTIVALPSPYTIARRMWSSEHSTAAYPTRAGFMEACIPIVNEELKRLTALGVDAIQLDDPWLVLLVDPEYRAREHIRDISAEIEMSIRGVNGAVQDVNHPFVSVHLCHAHGNRKHSTRGPYDEIIGALSHMNVHRFAMEFATPDAGGVGVLERFPQDKILGLGVIDHTDQMIETPEIVVERVEAVMKHVSADRLTLNPDCGFAPSSINPMDLDEAYLKLKALCDGAEMLRGRHG
jgi:5-methyltetrahydropteroyltriglutamate--homocysteine methyltransferase